MSLVFILLQFLAKVSMFYTSVMFEMCVVSNNKE